MPLYDHREIVLATSGLGKRFGKRWAVHGLNLQVSRGEVYGFLGPNGAGKSTTIRMVLSLIRPTLGKVLLFGQPLQTHRSQALSRVGGLVERPDFYLYLSARRNLQIIAGTMGGISDGTIDEVLDIVGLLPRAGDRVKTFSHGMKQRLGIAQALLGFPELVVLDEPTSGLDPQGIREVRDLIRRLAVERGMTVFLSSHLLHEIEMTATSMAIINRGALVAQGRVADLLGGPEVRVRLDSRPAEKTVALLTAMGIGGIERNGDSVEFTMDREKLPAVNRELVINGVEVEALIPRRSLEEYFLSITEGASEVAPVRTEKKHTRVNR